MSRFVEIRLAGGGDIHKGLGIAVHQGKPGALHLNHDAVAAAESMQNVRHGKLNLADLARLEGFRFLEAVPELAAENVATHKLLITSHVDMRRVWVRVGKVPGINIDAVSYTHLRAHETDSYLV